MIIQNANRCYEVMRLLDSTNEMSQYLCQEQQLQKAYLLVRIADGVLARRFTLFLEEKIKGKEFPDYIECFQQGGMFYAVFNYSLEPTLIDKLGGEVCSRKERAEIARKLLEKILLSSPHPYFMVNALRPDLITVSRSLSVSWNYHLENSNAFDSCTMEMVIPRIVRIMRLLFQEEVDKGLYPLLEDYLRTLGEMRIRTYLDLYREFMAVYAELSKEEQEERLPQTWIFRLWEKMKKLFGVLKKILMVVLLIGALWYVIYCFQNLSESRGMQRTIDQIGDIAIE